MAASSDVLRAKTDAELLFFVENSAYYEPELVAAAGYELRRRGRNSRPAAEIASAGDAGDADAGRPAGADTSANSRRWLAGAALGLALGAAGWLWQRGSGAQEQATAAATAAANRPGRLLPDSLQLKTAASAPIPTFNPDQDADRQLALVPAAERAQASAQALRQFRGLSLRFWRAQNPTAYLVGQADRPHHAEIYLSQLELVQGLWAELGKGLVYSYKLPPTMADHLARMRAIASIEHRTLTELQETQSQALGNSTARLTSATQQKQAEARRLLAPLQRYVAPLSVHLKPL